MVAFRSASGNTTTGATSFTVTKPTGVVSGDFLAAIVFSSTTTVTNLSISGGTSWTALTGGTVSTGVAYRVFWKSAGGSEPASYTVNLTEADTFASCSMVAANGGSSSTPVFAVDSTQAGPSSVDTPGITPTTAADLEIRFVAALSDGSLSTWTAPGALTERDDRRVVVGTAPFESDISTSAATRTLASSSATTSLAFTNAGGFDTNDAVGVTLSVGAGVSVISPSAIASAEAFGTAKLNLKVTGSGIASAEAFGTLVISTPDPQSIQVSGIASGEAFGALTTGLYVRPSGIASSEAFGDARLSAVIGPTGIASAEAFGTTNVAIEQFVSPSSIATAEAFGTPVLQLGYPQTIVCTGIPSGERMTQQPTARNVHRLVFRPPSIQETPAGRNSLHARYGIHRGISVIKRQNGTIYETRYPALTDLEAASKYWLGGYAHTISVSEKTELTAAGYGADITLEEVS